ncbi:scaffolding protein [Gordonia phage Culver]|nr:scaffolding protein [Gordonia phage Culver]
MTFSASHLPVHPVTGLRALGIGKRGPIWPVIGGAPDDNESGDNPDNQDDNNGGDNNAGDNTGGDNDSGAGDNNNDSGEVETSNGKPWAVDGEGNSLGYPAETPIAEMSIEEQMNYWKRQSRKKEDQLKKAKSPDEVEKLEQELQALKSKTQTADEKALEEALAAARAEGEQAARDFYLPALHETQLRGYAHVYIKDEKALNTWIEGIAIKNFVDTETQMVDGKKVSTYLEAIYGAPAPANGQPQPQFANVGQFQNRNKPRVDHAKQGAEIAARRFGTNTN